MIEQVAYAPRDPKLHGIWASIPTPFKDSGELDDKGIASNIDYYANSLQLNGVFCNGIMGEGWSLTLDERIRSAQIIVHSATQNALGTGIVVTAASLKETLFLARNAEDIGANHICISPPPGVTEAYALHRYIRAIRHEISLPIILIEASIGGFGTEMLKSIALERNLVSGIKIGTSTTAVSLLMDLAYDTDLVITDPIECHWLENLTNFEMKVLYADPEPYLFQKPKDLKINHYYQAFIAGKKDEARLISSQLHTKRQLYDRVIMQPLRAGKSPISSLKVWCECMGIAAGPPREPLTQLCHSQRQKLCNAISKLA